MNNVQVGDIVVSNNTWLIGLLGVPLEPGVILHQSEYSSIIYLFMCDEEITLMSDYVNKIISAKKIGHFQVGDLVELKPEIQNLLTIRGIGTVLSRTVIKTADFDGKFDDNGIDAYLVYFAEEKYEFTIPATCLQLF